LDDAKTPVLIGLAQLIQRVDDPSEAMNPLDMIERIAREAAVDSGAGNAALDAIDTLAIVGAVGWNPPNPARMVGERLGIEAATEICSKVGGETPLVLVNEVAERIMAGTTKVALVAGSNDLDTLMAARKKGIQLDRPHGGSGEPILIGTDTPGTDAREESYGINQPTNIYPIIENALRARLGRGLDEHRRKLGELMAPFTRVAAENPYAWFPVARSAEELITVSEANRMISYPYTKYLNAVLFTDQAAGVILTSKAAADALGVPAEKQVFWWGGANTIERPWFVSQRPNLGESAALTECARRTFENAGVGIDEIDHFDFYSCFPVAVELACEAYGIAEDDPRGLTTTGGLPYAGGPGNNYAMHGLVTVAERLRGRSGQTGLATGNGWYVTKHSSSVWGSEPKPGKPPTSRWAEGPEVGCEPLEVADGASGSGVVDSYTIVYGRSGEPEQGIVLGRLDGDGRRFIANLPTQVGVLQQFAGDEGVGRKGTVAPGDDGRHVFTPS
jgi:acetyl-CoA C-acetyltransferase